MGAGPSAGGGGVRIQTNGKWIRFQHNRKQACTLLVFQESLYRGIQREELHWKCTIPVVRSLHEEILLDPEDRDYVIDPQGDHGDKAGNAFRFEFIDQEGACTVFRFSYCRGNTFYKYPAPAVEFVSHELPEEEVVEVNTKLELLIEKSSKDGTLKRNVQVKKGTKTNIDVKNTLKIYAEMDQKVQTLGSDLIGGGHSSGKQGWASELFTSLSFNNHEERTETEDICWGRGEVGYLYQATIRAKTNRGNIIDCRSSTIVSAERMTLSLTWRI